MAKGAAWLFLLRLFIRGLGFISTLILARLLVPADFGLVAMATAATAFIEMLGDFGFHVFLVQKQDLSSDDLDTAWTVQMIIAALQSAVLACLAIPYARFYGEPRLTMVMWILSASTLLSGAKNIGIIHFQRELQFHLEFRLRATCKLVAFVVTVALAWLMRSYWALVIGSVVLRVTELFLSYSMHPHRPRFRIRGSREIFSFSKWIYCNTTLNFLFQRSPDFVIGKLAGAGPLGLFSLGFEIAFLPRAEMAAPINRVAFPAYAKMRHDLKALQDGYLYVLGMIVIGVFPACLGISATANVLIPFLLGEKWAGSVPIVQILGIAGALGSLVSNAEPVFLAQGKPWILTWLMTLRIVILLPCMILITPKYGVIGTAGSFLLADLIVIPFTFSVIFRALRIRFMDLVRELYRPLVSGAVMYVIVAFWAAPVVKVTGNTWHSFAVFGLVPLGALIYAVCILLLWVISGKPAGSAEANIIRLLKERMHRWTARKPHHVLKGM